MSTAENAQAEEQPSTSETQAEEQPSTSETQGERQSTISETQHEEHPATQIIFPAGFEDQNLVHLIIKQDLGQSITDEDVADVLTFLEELDFFYGYEDDDYEDYF